MHDRFSFQDQGNRPLPASKKGWDAFCWKRIIELNLPPCLSAKEALRLDAVEAERVTKNRRTGARDACDVLPAITHKRVRKQRERALAEDAARITEESGEPPNSGGDSPIFWWGPYVLINQGQEDQLDDQQNWALLAEDAVENDEISCRLLVSAELLSVLGSRAGRGGVGQFGFDTGPDPPQGLASELDRADGAPQVLAADDSASAEIYECEDR